MPRTVQVLVDRAPTNIQVGKKRAAVYCPDVVLCVDQDSGFIYHQQVLQPNDGEEAVGAAAQAALADIGRENPGARVIWVARREQVAAALAACFGDADVWSESSESFGPWDEAYVGMDRKLGSGRGVLPYLWRGDITAEEAGALFEAAAHYYRMKPWEFITDSELLEKPNPDPGGKPFCRCGRNAQLVRRVLRPTARLECCRNTPWKVDRKKNHRSAKRPGRSLEVGTRRTSTVEATHGNEFMPNLWLCLRPV